MRTPALTFPPTCGIFALLFEPYVAEIHFNQIGEPYYGKNQDHRDPGSVRQREAWRLWGVPDFLPVCLQDQLWRCQPAVREQGEG